MSESNEHPEDQKREEPDPSQPDGARENEDFEDDDLDDLDALGVDGVVAQMTGDDPAAPQKRPRPVWVSAVVVLACLYPLFSMWGDFRYWLRSSEPDALGDSVALFEPGAAAPDLVDRYVSLEGTPDVQWATVLTKKSGAKVTYLRVLEGGGQLFAAVPRPEGKAGKIPAYPSGFTGRVTRMGDAGAFDWIARLYAQEGVTQLYEVSGQTVADAVSAGSASLSMTSQDGRSVVADPVDTIRLVARPQDARVLLGVESFPSAKAAEQAVAALGYPYTALGRGRSDLRRYVVRVPQAARDDARKALLDGVEGTVDENDPKEGVSVFPLSATYSTPAGELSLEGANLVFPYGDNTTAPGYRIEGDKLVEVELDDGRMRIPVAGVHAARVEKPVFVDPDGYLVEVGVEPGSQVVWGVLWLLVLGLAITNGFVLYGGLRRRAV
ncbi:MAG: hypothetical protein KUG77_01610 [Nannocystaceae bacterium]|nr:hypothetical protein [Nannocystaceae bacterium]